MFEFVKHGGMWLNEKSIVIKITNTLEKSKIMTLIEQNMSLKALET